MATSHFKEDSGELWLLDFKTDGYWLSGREQRAHNFLLAYTIFQNSVVTCLFFSSFCFSGVGGRSG